MSISKNDDQRSPKAANTQKLEEGTQQLNQSGYDDKKHEFINQTNEFPSTFDYGSLEVMKKQLSFLQEQLDRRRRNVLN